jgi:hypothetical protein
MRKTIALIIIVGLLSVFMASCSVGRVQEDETLTTQTNQQTETRVIQVTVTSTPTYNPEECTHILRNDSRFYWNEDSSSIIYDNIREENMWFQIFIGSGEVAVLTNDEVSRIVGTDRMYAQPNLDSDYGDFNFPNDAYVFSISPFQDGAIYGTVVNIENIEPTPNVPPTPTPTFDPSWMGAGEHWIGGILVYTYEIFYIDLAGEIVSLGEANGDFFGVEWYPDGSGAVISRAIGGPMHVDWTSPAAIWTTDLTENSLQEIGTVISPTEDFYPIGISPDARYVLYTIWREPDEYILDLETLQISVLSETTGNFIWCSNNE